MKHEKKLKEHEIVWTCNFCKNKFKTKEESDKHKAKCIQNPKTGIFPYNNKPRLTWLFLWITAILSFLVVVIITTKIPSYQSNHYLDNFLVVLFMTNIGVGIFSFLAIFARHKFKNNQVSIFTKYIFVICLIYFLISFTPFIFANYLGRSQDLKEDYSKYLSISTPATNNFPVEKLELQNIKYDGKVLTGSILNKGDKPTFNTKLSLKISKDRSVWSIEEQHDFIVQYKIDPNQSVKFSENFKTTKINPWTATAIVEAKYYNGENILTPTLVAKKIIKPTSVPTDTDPMINCNISANCGGGTRRIKQSECSNGTCCQIGSSWIFYTSKQKCDEDQEKYNFSGSYNYSSSTNPTPTNIPVSTNVAPTVIPTTYQQPTPTINQAAIDTANEERISHCQGDCRRTGSSNETAIRQRYMASGMLGSSFYYQAIADNNVWTENCINECH